MTHTPSPTRTPPCTYTDTRTAGVSPHTRTHTDTRTHTHTPTGAQPPGFTLVETAIIVIVIGIIAALVIPAITSRITMDRGVQGRGDVISVRDEIIGFAMQRERLPGMTAGEVNATDISSLPKAQAGDFWGQQFMYRESNGTDGTGTVIGLLSESPNLCDANGTDLIVQRGGQNATDIAFIIKSNGPNMRDDIDIDITTFTTANPVPVHATGQEVGGNAFDDIVEFVTLDHLQDRLCSPSPSPSPGTASPVNIPNLRLFLQDPNDPTVLRLDSQGEISNNTYDPANPYDYSYTGSGSGGRTLILYRFGSEIVSIYTDRNNITYDAIHDSLGTRTGGNRGTFGANHWMRFTFPQTKPSLSIDFYGLSSSHEATIAFYDNNGLIQSSNESRPANYHSTVEPIRFRFNPTSEYKIFRVTALNAGFGIRGISAPYYPAPVPRTGQTTSYATGDDGDLQKGEHWPSPRFVVNGDGTVTDYLTGLVWVRDYTHSCFSPSSPRTWPQALDIIGDIQNLQCGLSDDSNPGDWRMPNVKEMFSLLNFSLVNNKLSYSFTTNISSSSDPVWTSTIARYTTPPPVTEDPYTVGVFSGRIGQSTISFQRRFLAVRDSEIPIDNMITPLAKSGQTTTFRPVALDDDGALEKGLSWPNPRFTDNGDGSVTDNLTGLIWLKNAHCSGSNSSWGDSLNLIVELNSSGTMDGNNCGDASKNGNHQTDWRLPNILEMLSLFDYEHNEGQPNLPSPHPFNNVSVGHFYWTSTTTDYGTYYVIPSNGTTDYQFSSHRTWPVRGGD